MMLNRLLQTEDDDFVPEERIYSSKKQHWFNVWYIAIGILAIFPYICIPILFAMVANIDQSGDTNNYYTNSVTTEVSSSIRSLSNGKVVSINSDGNIQLGGGTSIYKNIIDMNFLCPSYLSMDSIFNDSYIISYANKYTSKSTLQIVYVDPSIPNTGLSVYLKEDIEYYIYEIVTLSTTDGLFVGICQDYSKISEDAYIIVGQVTKDYDIKLTRSDAPYTSLYSVQPVITRMSDNSFAIVYYNYQRSTLETSYGNIVVNAADTTVSIQLYDAQSFLNDASNGTSFNAIGLSPTSYLIFYYNNTHDVDRYYGYGPLHTILVTLNANENILLFSNSTELKDSAVIFSLAATMLDSNTAVVAYTDALLNYAVVCQTITLETDEASDITDIIYGSFWAVTSGQTLYIEPSGMMDIDISKITDENQFMVLFSDISNKGIMTATIGELTDSGEIIRASADFLLNEGNNEFSHYYTWGSIAAGIKTPYSSTTAILTSKTNFDCSKYASTMFSMMEIKPTPYGIIGSTTTTSNSNSKYNDLKKRILTSFNSYPTMMLRKLTTSTASKSNDDDSITVTISGVIQNIYNKLNPNILYYSNTMGDLMNSNIYVGRSSKQDFAYVVDDATDTIITCDSKIGFAISKDSLFVQINN